LVLATDDDVTQSYPPPRRLDGRISSHRCLAEPPAAWLYWPSSQRKLTAWARAANIEMAYTPTNASWLNRIEAQFTALRYFALDGTDHPSHKEQASMIRRYIIWRNNHAYDERLRRIVNKANVA
jgi:hypothetical protein